MTTETKPHPHADLLRAIADGRQMQRNIGCSSVPRWVDVSADVALDWISEFHGDAIRIKPRTRKVVWWTRAYWSKYTAKAEVERETTEEGCRSREAAVEKWSSFGGWLTDWQRHEAEVEDARA